MVQAELRPGHDDQICRLCVMLDSACGPISGGECTASCRAYQGTLFARHGHPSEPGFHPAC
jgi:hypothetical protein